MSKQQSTYAPRGQSGPASRHSDQRNALANGQLTEPYGKASPSFGIGKTAHQTRRTKLKKLMLTVPAVSTCRPLPLPILAG
jgi:hypothetical protein